MIGKSAAAVAAITRRSMTGIAGQTSTAGRPKSALPRWRSNVFHFIKAKSRIEAMEECPGAAVYVKYRKGWRVFDYAVDYKAYIRLYGNAA